MLRWCCHFSGTDVAIRSGVVVVLAGVVCPFDVVSLALVPYPCWGVRVGS